MEEVSLTPFIIGGVLLVFITIGLIAGGMLMFNVTMARFSRLDLRQLVTMLFFTVVLLGGFAMILDVVVR